MESARVCLSPLLPAAAHSVGHTIHLMDAKTPLLVKAGLSRLTLLLSLDAARDKALECGAAPKLLGLLRQEDAGAPSGAVWWAAVRLALLHGSMQG